MYYAQLNSDNICISVIQANDIIDSENMVMVDNFSSDYLFRKYENGVWSEETFGENIENTENGIPSTATKSELQQIKEIQLLQLNAQAEIYEEQEQNNLRLLSAVAEIYENMEVK